MTRNVTTLHVTIIMKVLPEVLEIIFEMRKKMSNGKITRKEIRFPIYKTYILFYFFFGPLLFSNLITFLFLIHFKQFKML
jgi:hypothetical protein